MANTLSPDDGGRAEHGNRGRHLDDAEMVAALEGDLGSARAVHLNSCHQCRDTIDSLRGIAASAAAVEIPEPSPLFWDHFSARVRDAVAYPAPSRGLRGRLRRPAVAGLLAAAAVLLAVLVSREPSRQRAGESARTANASLNPSSLNAVDDDADNDEAWGLVRAVADEVGWDEAHDAVMNARPGSADGMAMELTAAEQHELAQLLRDELRRPGA